MTNLLLLLLPDLEGASSKQKQKFYDQNTCGGGEKEFEKDGEMWWQWEKVTC
jgi:hypothetical protein